MPLFNPKPPRLARLLLRLRPLGTRRAEVTADLDEVFAERTAAEGAGRAARRYYHDVLIAAGAGVALLASQLFAGILYGVGPRDPLAFASAIGILLVAAAAAVFIPARRAARVDPAFVLRQS